MGNLYLYHFAKQAFVKFRLQRPDSSKMSRLGKFFLSYQINLKNFGALHGLLPQDLFKEFIWNVN